MERKSAYETQSQRNCCKNNGTDLTGQHLYPVQSAESANCHCADLCSRMVELIFCSGGRIEHHHRYCTGTESQAADRKADAFVPVECQNRTERRTALCSWKAATRSAPMPLSQTAASRSTSPCSPANRMQSTKRQAIPCCPAVLLSAAPAVPLSSVWAVTATPPS